MNFSELWGKLHDKRYYKEKFYVSALQNLHSVHVSKRHFRDEPKSKKVERGIMGVILKERRQ